MDPFVQQKGFELAQKGFGFVAKILRTGTKGIRPCGKKVHNFACIKPKLLIPFVLLLVALFSQKRTKAK